MTDAERLEQFGVKELEKGTHKKGVQYKFQYLGRVYTLKKFEDHYEIKGLTFKKIPDVITWLAYRDIPSISKKYIYTIANKELGKQCLIDWWIDDYILYLSNNDLRDTTYQLEAFYDWWRKRIEHESVPSYNLLVE